MLGTGVERVSAAGVTRDQRGLPEALRARQTRWGVLSQHTQPSALPRTLTVRGAVWGDLSKTGGNTTNFSTGKGEEMMFCCPWLQADGLRPHTHAYGNHASQSAARSPDIRARGSAASGRGCVWAPRRGGSSRSGL